jgi:8-oxo-dGTP pyrophosphatase MutT (NUDIX family)
MDLDFVQGRVRAHRPAMTEAPAASHAAVAIVLQQGEHGAEFIAIHRAHRQGDPWSGHMALPGGKQDPSDVDLQSTAMRETREEVGVDLARLGEFIGHLDDLQAVARGRALDLIIRPYVWSLHHPAVLVPDHREVQSAFWIPLLFLRKRDARGSIRYALDGQELELPAFLYQGHTIWGLTHRILTGLLEILDR